MKTKQVFTSLYNYPINNKTKSISNVISISLKNLNASPTPANFNKNFLIQSPVHKVLVSSDSQRKTMPLYQSYSGKKKF